MTKHLVKTLDVLIPFLFYSEIFCFINLIYWWLLVRVKIIPYSFTNVKSLSCVLFSLSVNKVNLTGLVSEISPGNSYLGANIDVCPEYLCLISTTIPNMNILQTCLAKVLSLTSHKISYFFTFKIKI